MEQKQYLTFEDIERIYTTDYLKYIFPQGANVYLSEKEKNFLLDIAEFNKKYIKHFKKMIELNLYFINEILNESVVTDVEANPQTVRLSYMDGTPLHNKINIINMVSQESFFKQRNGRTVFVDPSFDTSKEAFLEVIVENYNYPNLLIQSKQIGMLRGSRDLTYEYSKVFLELDLLNDIEEEVNEINNSSIETLLNRHQEILSMSIDEYRKKFEKFENNEGNEWETELENIFHKHDIKIDKRGFALHHMSNINKIKQDGSYFRYIIFNWNDVDSRIKENLLLEQSFLEFVEYHLTSEINDFFYRIQEGDDERIQNCINVMIDSIKFQDVRYLGSIISGIDLGNYQTEPVKIHNKQFFWKELESKIVSVYAKKVEYWWENRLKSNEKDFWNSVFLAKIIKTLGLKGDDTVIDLENFSRKIIPKSMILEDIGYQDSIISDELFLIYLKEFKNKIAEYDIELKISNTDIKIFKLLKPIKDEPMSAYNFSLDECIDNMKKIFTELVGNNSLEILEKNMNQKIEIVKDFIDIKFRELCLYKDIEKIDKKDLSSQKIKRKV